MCQLGWTQKQQASGYASTQVINVPQNFQGAMVSPMLCDYEMLTTKVVETTFTPTIKLSGMPAAPQAFEAWMQEFVFEAQAQLIKEHNADAIIGLSRAISTSQDGTIKVVVRGFPVKYVNFRKATEKDVWMAQFYLHMNPNLQHVNLGNFMIEK